MLSPIYGDFHGFPPAILTTGTRDLFLSNTVRTHRKLRDAGIERSSLCSKVSRMHSTCSIRHAREQEHFRKSPHSSSDISRNSLVVYNVIRRAPNTTKPVCGPEGLALTRWYGVDFVGNPRSDLG
jgi:acetyl esterase/lipase